MTNDTEHLFICLLTINLLQRNVYSNSLSIVLGFFRETEPIGCVYVIYIYKDREGVCVCVCVCLYMEKEREREILGNWLTALWRQTSPNSAGLTGRLETQGRVDTSACV